jgi:hypothetical protein
MDTSLDFARFKALLESATDSTVNVDDVARRIDTPASDAEASKMLPMLSIGVPGHRTSLDLLRDTVRESQGNFTSYCAKMATTTICPAEFFAPFWRLHQPLADRPLPPSSDQGDGVHEKSSKIRLRCLKCKSVFEADSSRRCPNCGCAYILPRSMATPKASSTTNPVERKTSTRADNRARARDYSNSGSRYAISGDMVRARQEWQAAIRTDPTWAVPYFNMAKSYADSGDQGQALAYVDQARQRASGQSDSDDAEVLSQCAILSAVLRRKRW